MTEDRDTYDATKARLEDIVVAVRRKDTSLEKSIDLLEEGVRLANLCTEQVDAVGSMLETMRMPPLPPTTAAARPRSTRRMRAIPSWRRTTAATPRSTRQPSARDAPNARG